MLWENTEMMKLTKDTQWFQIISVTVKMAGVLYTGSKKKKRHGKLFFIFDFILFLLFIFHEITKILNFFFPLIILSILYSDEYSHFGCDSHNVYATSEISKLSLYIDFLKTNVCRGLEYAVCIPCIGVKKKLQKGVPFVCH